MTRDAADASAAQYEEQDEFEAEEEFEPFEGGPIVGRTAVTAEDFKGVWTALPQHKRTLTQLVSITLLVPAFTVFQFFSVGDRSPNTPMGWILIGGPLLIAAALARGFLTGRTRWANSAVEHMRSLEGVDFRFDDEAVTIAAPGRKTITGWSSLSHCLEMPSAFALYISPTSLMAVPKRAFAANDLARLHALFLARVPSRPAAEGKQQVIRTVALWLALVTAFLAVRYFLAP